MNQRRADVQAFVDSVRAGYEASDMDADTRRCIQDVFSELGRNVGSSNEGGLRQPACAHLPQALRNVRSSRDVFAPIAQSFERLEHLITWTRRSKGPNASANVMDGHANAMVVGPGGLEDRPDVHIGLTIMAPHVRYFDHRHPPEETYLILTPGSYWHGEDTDWFEPRVGSSFYNTPNIIHAMRSHDVPLLAVWCLRDAKD
jgi:quercetin dioxygenase-like cupin family protein